MRTANHYDSQSIEQPLNNEYMEHVLRGIQFDQFPEDFACSKTR